MTRRKRSPPPDSPSPRKRVAFQIPDSLAQLSALSRSLAQRADSISGVDKEKENSGIVARAQAFSHSPAQDEASPALALKPLSWRTDQKDFPDAQTWIQPNSSSGSRAYAKSREHKHSRPPLDSMAVLPQSYGSTVVEAEGAAFVNEDSHTWSQTSSRAAPRSFGPDTEHRRQAIIAQLMQTGPVSVSSAGANIQVPINTEAARLIENPVEEHVDPEQTLDLAKDSNQIAALIAKKRSENAATGQLNRLQHLQTEHRHKQNNRQSWPAVMQPLPHLSMPAQPSLQFAAWSTRPLPAPLQDSVETSNPLQSAGYAEASTATAGVGNDAADLDLRSLFSSPGHSPHLGNRNEDDEAERVLRSAMRNAPNLVLASNTSSDPATAAFSGPDGSEAASPSDQLLSNLAHVSSDALAELNTQHSTSDRPQGRTVPGPRLLPATKLTQLRRPYMPAVQTPQALAKVAATLTPEQQEVMLMRRQTERSKMEGKKNELRRIAEEKARRVQEQNQRNQSLNGQEEPQQPDQGQWIPQASVIDHSTANSSSWKMPSSFWGTTDTSGYLMSSPIYTQSQGVAPDLSTSASGDGFQRSPSAGYGSLRTSGSSTAARFRNASQSGFEIPKR